ncbi:hypothetical protein GLOIN_2v1882232 [Rhizophagus clarus]|uniref:Hsp70 family protein n=1 Tax=Rhizophagus clarus TaxID=94130 RepID=A0A8H3M4V5_9GLOM|nr:hypothetical protein GLOIN_2v1882232 [Rhizophagus clarus]
MTSTSETITKLVSDFKKLKERSIQLIEENKNLKQEIQVLKEKLQERDKQIEKFQERDKEFEKLQQHFQNLEKQKNEELLQLQELEMISQDLQNDLGILELDENDIKIPKENNEQQNYNANNSKTSPLPDKYEKVDQQQNYNTNNSTTPSTPPLPNKYEKVTQLFNESSEEDTEEPELHSNIQVVVGLDFGTTYSRFAYCSDEENICSYIWSSWRNRPTEIATVNLYRGQYKAGDFFKLYLGDTPDSLKPNLPVDYKRVITDYFREFGQVVKKQVTKIWTGINFFENVLLVLTVPTGFSEKDKDIMRECIYDAKLIRKKCSKKLQFIMESKAAALYCMKNVLEEYDLLSTGNTFMIVDCGGCTVDLSTYKLIGNNSLQLGKVTENIRDFCGSTFIDKEFIKFLRGKLGDRGIDLLTEINYNEFQALVQFFCDYMKYPFSLDNKKHFDYSFVERCAPSLVQYIGKDAIKFMEENDWSNRITYDDIRKMFIPIVDRIIRLIHVQLSNNQETCSGIFLIGGFSENKYLQEEIKREFCNKINIISVPDIYTNVIAHGAAIYGLSISSNLDELENNTSSSRVLDYTYVKQGTKVTSDQTFSFKFIPESDQTSEKFEVYYTNEDSATYVDEPGMKLLGVLNIDLPDAHLDNRCIDFGLIFGQSEIIAFARNELNGQKFVTTFYYE